MAYSLFGYDIESTSLDPKKGHIAELAFCLKDSGAIRSNVIKNYYVFDPSWGSNFIPAEATNIHQITNAIATRYGRPLREVFGEMAALALDQKVDFIVGHNIRKFDHPYLKYHTRDMGFNEFWEIPVIDTRTDIDWDKLHMGTQKLEFLCAKHQFLNPWPHCAFSDVLSMLKLLDMYDIEEVIRNSQSPTITLRAMVSFDQKDLAKAAGYYWHGETKSWRKDIKLNAIDVENARTFKVVKVSE